jgi:hypothetical protein
VPSTGNYARFRECLNRFDQVAWDLGLSDTALQQPHGRDTITRHTVDGFARGVQHDQLIVDLFHSQALAKLQRRPPSVLPRALQLTAPSRRSELTAVAVGVPRSWGSADLVVRRFVHFRSPSPVVE